MNKLVQYKTTLNFLVKIEVLGNGRLNKKWYPFGISISLTQKLESIDNQDFKDFRVLNLSSLTISRALCSPFLGWQKATLITSKCF
jgi:hypothetical protein